MLSVRKSYKFSLENMPVMAGLANNPRGLTVDMVRAVAQRAQAYQNQHCFLASCIMIYDTHEIDILASKPFIDYQAIQGWESLITCLSSQNMFFRNTGRFGKDVVRLFEIAWGTTFNCKGLTTHQIANHYLSPLVNSLRSNTLVYVEQQFTEDTKTGYIPPTKRS